MNKILRNVLAVALLLIANASFAAAYKTLSFPDENKENNKKQNYTSTWTAKIGDDSWTIANFNNNQWNNSWTYIRCGSKKNASTATIATDFAIDQPISSVVVTINKSTAASVNSISLVVSSDKEGSTVVETIEASSKEAGDLLFTVTNPQANCYYKLVFDCAQGTGNGFVEVSKVEYYKEGDTPEIVDISNTPETAYTVEKAKELIAAGKGLATEVYVGGIISSITEVSTTNGNATYNISDDGTTTSELVVYRGYYLKNEKFTSEDQIKVGDKVIVYGKLLSYSGTDEINSGNYLYSIWSTPTSISSLSTDETVSDAPAYNIAGQKVSASYKGVVIKGGKKLIQK